MIRALASAFFIALGIVLGGSFLGAIPAALIDQPPIRTMVELARTLKLWGMLSAMGGSFTALNIFEAGLARGDLEVLIHHILIMVAAFLGAHLAYLGVLAIAGER